MKWTGRKSPLHSESVVRQLFISDREAEGDGDGEFDQLHDDGGEKLSHIKNIRIISVIKVRIYKCDKSDTLKDIHRVKDRVNVSDLHTNNPDPGEQGERSSGTRSAIFIYSQCL